MPEPYLLPLSRYANNALKRAGQNSNFQPLPVVEAFDTESEIFSEQEVISEVIIDEIPVELEPALAELETHHDQVFDTAVTEL
ncbi:hypothetical protein, partial [Acinetobacter baumannii]|uniref:hypothetical protein n=1 Tax=Acinetobacter baumannii TaxID=470 RepID=UPI0020199884